MISRGIVDCLRLGLHDRDHVVKERCARLDEDDLAILNLAKHHSIAVANRLDLTLFLFVCRQSLLTLQPNFTFLLF